MCLQVYPAWSDPSEPTAVKSPGGCYALGDLLPPDFTGGGGCVTLWNCSFAALNPDNRTKWSARLSRDATYLQGAKTAGTLENALTTWDFTNDFALLTGDMRGEAFTYATGKIDPETPLSLLSGSKWPMAIALLGAIADGTLPQGLNTTVSSVIPWWTQFGTIQLYQLLSFTSGLNGDPHECEHADEFEACTKKLYKYYTTNPTKVDLPGTSWYYSSVHLRVAGMMVATASNMKIEAVVKRSARTTSICALGTHRHAHPILSNGASIPPELGMIPTDSA